MIMRNDDRKAHETSEKANTPANNPAKKTEAREERR